MSVGELAKLAGVTVRTLHHYDDIGLLAPSARSAAGHRLYTYEDLVRLQRILGYRALGLGLDAIAAILDDPSVDPVDHLRAQQARVVGEIGRLQEQLGLIARTMEAHRMGIELTPEEMFGPYADEAEQRWGDTEAYRESRRRTSAYTTEDWLRMKSSAAAVDAAFVAALSSGAPASSAEALAAAEAHRQHISRWFYECGHEMHRGLADLYVSDPRFTAYYDDQAPGLAQYVHDAIHANAS